MSPTFPKCMSCIVNISTCEDRNPRCLAKAAQNSTLSLIRSGRVPMARFAAFLACLSATSAFIAERDIFSSLGPQLSPGAAIYNPSSPQWANETARWSSFDQPTFVNVVLPATQADIVATVRVQSLFENYLINFRSNMPRQTISQSSPRVVVTDTAPLSRLSQTQS